MKVSEHQYMYPTRHAYVHIHKEEHQPLHQYHVRYTHVHIHKEERQYHIRYTHVHIHKEEYQYHIRYTYAPYVYKGAGVIGSRAARNNFIELHDSPRRVEGGL